MNDEFINKLSSIKLGERQGYLKGRARYFFENINKKKHYYPHKVLLIPTFWGNPYFYLNKGVEIALRRMVEKLIIFDENQSILKQVMAQKVDVILVLGPATTQKSFFWKEFEIICKMSIYIAIWTTDDPYYTDEMDCLKKYFDYIFTMDSSCVELYAARGSSVHYLPLGVSLEHYYPITRCLSDRKELSFIGMAFQNRINFFDCIMTNLMSRAALIGGLYWNRSKYFETYPDKIKNMTCDEWMEPIVMNENYNKTKIVLNMHRSVEDDEININQTMKLPALSPNVRTFEICAAGAFQLTDIREDLAKHYTPGIEIETYTSQEELLEKIDYYLAHEEEREAIALRGLKRTLKEHTYEHRMDQMLNIIFSEKYKRQ